MRYPQLVSTLLYKKETSDTYTVRNYLTDCDFTLGIECCDFIQCLDGKTDPYSIETSFSRDEVKHFMRWLEKNKLTRTSRVQKYGLLSFTISLFKVKATLNMKVAAWFLNIGLMVLFLPLLAIGIFGYLNYYHPMDNDVDGILFLVGVALGLFGLVLHECGHIIAGLAYKAKVSEVGLLIGLFNFGAFVEIYDEFIENRLKRAQIMAAGVEMNFAFSGVSLIIATIFVRVSALFYGIAFINLLLGITNLLPIYGVDGFSIINQILNGELYDVTFDLIFDRKSMKREFKQGVIGYVRVGACIIGLISQITYPLLIIFNIVSIGEIFK